MKRIDVTELQEKISNSAALNESLEVERDGCLVGYFLPIKKKDPEKIKAAIDRLDAAIEHALAGSTLTRDEFADLLDLSKPFPLPYDD